MTSATRPEEPVERVPENPRQGARLRRLIRKMEPKIRQAWVSPSSSSSGRRAKAFSATTCGAAASATVWRFSFLFFCLRFAFFIVFPSGLSSIPCHSCSSSRSLFPALALSAFVVVAFFLAFCGTSTTWGERNSRLVYSIPERANWVLNLIDQTATVCPKYVNPINFVHSHEAFDILQTIRHRDFLPSQLVD